MTDIDGPAEGDPRKPVGDQKALGRAVRAVREREGLSLEVVAQKAEIEVQTLIDIEAGKGDADWNTVTFVVEAMGESMGPFGQLETAFKEEEEAADQS